MSVLDALRLAQPTYMPRPQASVRTRPATIGMPNPDKPRRVVTRGTVGMLEDDFRQLPMSLMPEMPQFTPTAGRGAAPEFSVSQEPYTVPLPPVMQEQVDAPKGFAGLLGGLDDPTVAGLGAAGASLLQSTGYSTVPRTTGQVLGEAFQAFNVARQQAQIRAEDVALKKAKLATEQAKSGLPYQGTSMDAQDRNTVLLLSDKVKNNTATASERSAYRMSLSKLTQPKELRTFGENGELVVTKVPPTDVGGVFIPDDMKSEVEQSAKPTALMQKQRARLPKLQSAAGLINKYRRALIDAKKSGLYEGFAGVGQFTEAVVPSREMVELKNVVTEIRLSIKDMEELGALVGGDFAILDALVLDPDSPTALRLGADVLISQIDNLEERLVERISAAQELSGLEGDNVLNFQGTYRSPYMSVTKEQLKNLPPNSYFVAKDDASGQIRFKGAM